jgi:nicotinate dehydrogenase subunit B
MLPAGAPWPQRRGFWAAAGALSAGVLSVAASLFGARPAIAPITPPDLSMYTTATLERGRALAAAGNCIDCHTAPGGLPNAGGRAMQTPFGTVHSTNLTPDPVTGIGGWSLAAFTRAMREGLSRDGRHLYPVFPYTAFAHLSDDDITALYAHLMSQPAIKAAAPANQLRFPFDQRPLLALWKGLFHDPAPQPLADRGAYLVKGIGHCAACHSPRNALGAEVSGKGFLAGGSVNGWQAQPLTAANAAPVAWTADEFYRYLRLGHTQHHGSVGGPMVAVVHNLQALPDSDIRAMAGYLASFNPAGGDSAVQAQSVLQRASAARELSADQRLFDSACGACHYDADQGGPQVFGLNQPLAFNSNLHGERPDNLLRTVLDGISQAATPEHGFMPAFRHNLSDQQIAEIAAYMRRRFAPDKPPWPDLPAHVGRLRAVKP